MIITGSFTNLLTGWLLKWIRADVLLLRSALITTVAPVLLATVNPDWSYWTCAFLATACLPVCADVLFTVAVLLIASVFPPQTHGLAGVVFNMISNIGKGVGLAVTSGIASRVAMAENVNREETPQRLMHGYRVTFWLCFGVDVLILGVEFGLRKIWKVGIKTEYRSSRIGLDSRIKPMIWNSASIFRT
jgi:nitrate/nitrite transporter NarK